MHISIVAYGTWGDALPSVALALALERAGYGVRLIVTRDFADLVKGTGLEYQLLPIDKREVMRQVSSETNPLRGILAIRRVIAPRLLDVGLDLLSTAQDTDVLVVNEWGLGVASGIAQAFNLKLIYMAMEPQMKTREMPICTMPALPSGMPFRAIYNHLSYEIAHRNRWWTYGHIGNTLRTTYLDLEPLSAADYVKLLAQIPSITLVSPHVVPRPADWAGHQRMTGFLFYDRPHWHPPDKLVNFIENGPKPVYIGFGSMHDRHPLRTTRTIIDALKRINARAVLYGGWADLGRTELPDTVYLLDYAEHNWLFPRMAAIVHHAGAGTSAAALRARVPSVPVPHSGDQFFWARRLHQIGAGTEPLARARLDAGGLAERVAVALSDSRLAEQAAKFGDWIRSEDGRAAAVSAIGEMLESS